MRLMVVGFYGLMVVSASAAETRWPANVCEEIAQMEKITADSYAKLPTQRAHARAALLTQLKSRCGVDISAKWAADNAALEASVKATPKRRSTSTPLTCATVNLGGGDSATQCF